MKNVARNVALDVEWLYPHHRTVVSKATDLSLDYLHSKYDLGMIHNVPSFKKLPGNWQVPEGWSLVGAQITRLSDGAQFDLSDTNLRVPSHSKGFCGIISRDELLEKAYTHRDIGAAVPYVTLYYNDDWGICLKKEEISWFEEGDYEVSISVNQAPHFLRISETVLQGKIAEEIWVTSYLCHPSMVNNELTGPIALANLYDQMKSLDLNYTYRFLLWPETIGSIAYLQMKRLQKLPNVRAALTLSCLGLRSNYSIVTSPNDYFDYSGDLSSYFSGLGKVANVVPYSERGSDERQLNFPANNIVALTVSRGRFGAYPEYHSSFDDKNLVEPEALAETIHDLFNVIKKFDDEARPNTTQTNEPFLSGLDLYPKISRGSHKSIGKDLNFFLTCCNGGNSLRRISEVTGFSSEYVEKLNRIALKHNFLG